MGENRFSKALKGQGEKIINAGITESKAEKKQENTALNSNEPIINKTTEDIKYGEKGYSEYRVVNIKNTSKKGDKYSVGIMLSKDTLQKTYYAQMLTGTDLVDYYEYAVKLFYDINFIFKKKGINLFTEKLRPEEVIKILRNIEINEDKKPE